MHRCPLLLLAAIHAFYVVAIAGHESDIRVEVQSWLRSRLASQPGGIPLSNIPAEWIETHDGRPFPLKEIGSKRAGLSGLLRSWPDVVRIEAKGSSLVLHPASEEDVPPETSQASLAAYQTPTATTCDVDEFRRWLEELVSTAGPAGVHAAQLGDLWEKASGAPLSLQALGFSKKQGLSKMLAAWRDIVCTTHTDRGLMVYPPGAIGAEGALPRPPAEPASGTMRDSDSASAGPPAEETAACAERAAVRAWLGQLLAAAGRRGVEVCHLPALWQRDAGRPLDLAALGFGRTRGVSRMLAAWGDMVRVESGECGSLAFAAGPAPAPPPPPLPVQSGHVSSIPPY